MKAVNLIPVEQRVGTTRGAGASQGGAYAVLALLAGLALLALVYGVAHHQVSSRRAKAVALEAQVAQVQANAASLAPYSAFVALRDQRVQAVSQLVNSRFDWAHAVHELGRVLPANVSITTLTGAVGATGGASSSASASAASAATPAAGKAGAVASSTPPGSVPTLSLSGCAKSQSTVAQVLDRLRLMDGASSVALQSSTKATGSGGTGGSVSCPSTYPVFSAQVTYVPLPASTATSAPAVAKPVSSTRGAAKSPGGSR